MNNFQQEIDERTNLALSNQFELLVFRLGVDLNAKKSGLFGINIFKLREIVPMTTITKAAGMKPPLLGMSNIRGQIIPVIDLPAVMGCKPNTGLNLLLVTEYARNLQAFAVESVEDIVRLHWSQVHASEAGVSSRNITSIACLNREDQETAMVLVLDVEQIRHDVIPSVPEVNEGDITLRALNIKPGSVAIVAEDSRLARQMLDQSLKAMGIPALIYNSGLEAWQQIRMLAQQAKDEAYSVSDKIALVLTDIEMPEMDGFTLTRNIKNDINLRDIPVVIHSSLSGSANEEHVRKVGANAYVAKFDINQLSSVIHQLLEDTPG